MKTEPLSPRDPSSYSRPEISLVRHVDLEFKVNFAERTLDGAATLHFDILQDTEHLILDVSELAIQSVQDEARSSELKYSMTEHLPSYGSKMTVQLPAALKPGNKTSIHVKYKTSPTATALQWLEPAQTFGKKMPFLFSQCQPIHARSIVPIQDTPAVKFTYEARVTAEAHYTALMSARRGAVEPAQGQGQAQGQGPADSVTRFSQPVPVPAYLLALAVGALHSRPLGPRSCVWAEEEVVERAAWEFADTERFLRAAEAACGPYVWGPYELLVLPPSFPYGGMENPCLTFVTPTLLAGDRSQADVIVHEIMHSWSGNLVTNRNFEHFWLNEGLTVYLERRVGASLIEDPVAAASSRDFHSLLGLQTLKDTITGHLGADSPLTKLVVDLRAVHPDDAFSSVPYEKGSLFLRYLEDLVGGPEVFEGFVRAYLEKFARQSVDTEQFRALFVEHFKGTPAPAAVDWHAWLHAPGMPPHIPKYDTTMSKVCTELAERIVSQPAASISAEDVKDFDTHQMVTVLEELIDKPSLPLDKLAAMRAAYKLKDSKNTEIKFRWLRLCLKARDEAAVQESLDFVNSQGRMKYVRPLYRELYNWTQTRDRAVKNFNQFKGQMMHVSAQTLMKDLHLV